MSTVEEKLKKLAQIGQQYLKGELKCPSCKQRMSHVTKANAETQTSLAPTEETKNEDKNSATEDCCSDKINGVPSSHFSSTNKGQDEADWPVAHFEPDHRSVAMYPKKLVYPSGTKEYSLEELKAKDYFEKLLLKKEKKPLEKEMSSLKVEEIIHNSLAAPDKKEEDVSNAQSVTLRTEIAWNLVQNMWSSPTTSEPSVVAQEAVPARRVIPFPVFDENSENRPENVAGPLKPPSSPVEKSVPKPKFDIYTDNSIRKDEFCSEKKNPAMDRPTLQLKTAVLSERKEPAAKVDKETQERTVKDGVKKSLDFQENLPLVVPAFIKPFKEAQPDLSEVTCCTKNFEFILPSSTPVAKKKQQSTGAERHTDNGHVRAESDQTTQQLSVIAEASHERCSSSSSSQGSSGHHPITPAAKGVKSTLEDMENVDPFSSELKKKLLDSVKFNEEYANKSEYTVLPTKLPPMNKNIKLGTQMYAVLGEIGKGAFGRVMRARLSDGSEVALKLEKPACQWEFYISKEIQKRVEPRVRAGFLHFNQAFIYNDGSILVAKLAEYGTLLNAVSRHKVVYGQTMAVSVVIHFAMEMMAILDYLHQARIVHGDIKPDNFVIRNLPQASEQTFCLLLIDFGRSIDMSLFPENTAFTRVVTTEGFSCNEMKDRKPWTYHTDLYGLAASLYVTMTCDYMKDNVKRGGKWKLSSALPRMCVRELWEPVFDKLLNHDSFDPIDMASLIDPLKEAYDKVSDSAKKIGFNKLRQAITK